ncbi:MAG TPA: polysaccharide pyruvyl transferase family protein, partial [Bellilinea sp.]|nr:polysaccharide pyruvyl transferase family protein [Bellilinea sp.]
MLIGRSATSSWSEEALSTETRILIVSIHSSKNAGDLALLECTIHQLQAGFDHPKITLSCNWPKEEYFINSGYEVVQAPWDLSGLNDKTLPGQLFSFLYDVVRSIAARVKTPPSHRQLTGWEGLFEAYRRADLVVGVAGNQFYSTGRFGWPFPVSLMPVYLANKFRKPFYTMPQSIGPLRRGWERSLLKKAYQHARVIHVRDEVSRVLAKDIGIPNDITCYEPDPAFNFPPVERDQAIQFLKEYGYQPDNLALGVSVLGSMGRTLPDGSISNYYQVLAAGLRRFLEHTSANVYLFSQVTGPTKIEDDRLGAATVANLLHDYRERVVNVDGVIAPAMLKACYGLMDFFIPSRLHSGIFALGMNVPCLFVGYLSKTRGVLRSIGLEDWVIDLKDFTEEN